MEVPVRLNMEKLIELHELDLGIRQSVNNLEAISTEREQIERRPKDYIFNYDDTLEDLKKQIDEVNRRLTKLNSKRKKVVEDLPEIMAALYESIRGRHGAALADAGNACCQGCNMVIRYMVLKKVRKGDQITTCENCGRILYCKPASGSKSDKKLELEKAVAR
jgi:hypothetical protein